jgi:hypothetical protein
LAANLFDLSEVISNHAKMLSRQQAKRHLKILGWSYRTAAPVLHVTYPHLAKVLNGQRESRRLLTAIKQLPRREMPSES